MGKGKYGLGRVYQPTYNVKDEKGNITKRTVNSWYIEWRDDNGQHREATSCKTENEARHQLRLRLGQGELGTAPKAGEKSLRYGDIRALLFQKYQLKKLRTLEYLADGTMNIRHVPALDKFFGWSTSEPGPKVSELAHKFETFILARRNEGVSEATIRASAIHLQSMLNLALEKGLISKKVKVTIPSEAPSRETFITKFEFDQVLSVMKKKYHPLMTWLFFQGRRMGETFKLDWSKLQLSEGAYTPNPLATKTREGHVSPLNSETVRALRPFEKKFGPVFENLARRSFEKRFRTAILKLKLGRHCWQCFQCYVQRDGHQDDPQTCPTCERPMVWQFAGPTPHSLRASCVAFYRAAGLDDISIMKITGHKTLEAYVGYAGRDIDTLKQRIDGALNNYNAYVNGLEKPGPRLVASAK